MTKTIEVGTIVFDNSGSEYTYAGPHDHSGWFRVKYDFRSSGPNEVECDVDMVAPLEALNRVNLKDPRISVVRKDEKPAYASGKWLHTIFLPDGTMHQGWHKTKRDGVAECAHRLAIADWHAEG